MKCDWDLNLTPAEMRLAEWYATQRHQRNRAGGVADRQIGPQSSEKTDLLGMIGELAFAKHHNVCPDLTLGPRRGGVDGILDGYRYDVKATDLVDGRLLVPVYKERLSSYELPELYALVVVTGDRCRGVGCAWATEIIQDRFIMDLGHGPTYTLSQKQLWTWQTTRPVPQPPPETLFDLLPVFNPKDAF